MLLFAGKKVLYIYKYKYKLVYMSLLFVFQLSVLCVLMEIRYVDESCLTETVQLKRKRNKKKKKWVFVCILFNYLSV